MDAITLTQLSKSFKGKRTVDHLDMHVPVKSWKGVFDVKKGLLAIGAVFISAVSALFIFRKKRQA